MLKVNLLFAQDKLDPSTREGLAEYRKRLSKVCQLDWQCGADLSESMRCYLTSDSTKVQVVRLDRNGDALTSPELAQLIQAWTTQGKSQLIFLMGHLESTQKNEPSRTAAGSCYQLSLSPVQLSESVTGHLAAEQIYRAFRILGHQPYHK